jgi:hypothetical protein
MSSWFSARASSAGLLLVAALLLAVPRAALATPRCDGGAIKHRCCASRDQHGAEHDAVRKPPCTCCIKQAPAPTTSGVLAPEATITSLAPVLFDEPAAPLVHPASSRVARLPHATGPPLRSHLRTIVLLL